MNWRESEMKWKNRNRVRVSREALEIEKFSLAIDAYFVGCKIYVHSQINIQGKRQDQGASQWLRWAGFDTISCHFS